MHTLCFLLPAQVLTPLISQQHSTVPINDLSTPISVDTPIFRGNASLCLRHMPSTPKGVFEGKRRQMVLTVQVGKQQKQTQCCCNSTLLKACAAAWFPLTQQYRQPKRCHKAAAHSCALLLSSVWSSCPTSTWCCCSLPLLPVWLQPSPHQGRFKQPNISLDSLVLGSEFTRPLKLPAGPLISSAVMWLAQKLGGGVSVSVGGKSPHILAPLIAAAQVVHVAVPGQEPDLQSPHEDMRLFDAGLVSTWTGVLGERCCWVCWG